MKMVWKNKIKKQGITVSANPGCVHACHVNGSPLHFTFCLVCASYLLKVKYGGRVHVCVWSAWTLELE
jgi:hypothetical protein